MALSAIYGEFEKEITNNNISLASNEGLVTNTNTILFLSQITSHFEKKLPKL